MNKYKVGEIVFFKNGGLGVIKGTQKEPYDKNSIKYPLSKDYYVDIVDINESQLFFDKEKVVITFDIFFEIDEMDIAKLIALHELPQYFPV